jgi:bifunctional non-homologous end joining protein LigD
MTAVEIDGRRLVLTNLDKVLYPETGLTKAGVIEYAARIAPAMLPHLEQRALTLVRCPDGVDGERFFEKRCPPHRPGWIRTGGDQNNCLIDEPAGLVWLANLAALELHTLQARVDAADRPLGVVFDLDPGPPAGVRDCCRVALELRGLLDQLALRAVVKTSGGKGLHVFVPLHTVATDDETKGFALAVGQLLARQSPESVVVAMAREQRRGKVFVDWSQNDRNKTTIAPYSLRALPRPTVSTPITWDEVASTAGVGSVDSLRFECSDVLARVAEHGDLFADALRLEQELPGLS